VVDVEGAVEVAADVGYPVLVRPSYVLGGRAMEIIYDEKSLRDYFRRTVVVSPDHPILIDRFLEDAFEADVDAVCDGERCLIGGIMQHIEDAGIHSGDSACVLPSYLIDEAALIKMAEFTRSYARALGVVGLINVQYAVKDGVVYVLEVNPRGSRTIPFVSKATGVSMAKLAAAVMIGKRLDDVAPVDEIPMPCVAVKEAVFPFTKLPDVDTLLGPEMRSTGEVMGIADSLGMAYAKAQSGAGSPLPLEGSVFVTVNDSDKSTVTPIVRRFHEMGYDIVATDGTARYLRSRGIPTKRVFKIYEGRPNISDLIVSGQVQLLINTPLGKLTQKDDYFIRRTALQRGIPYATTMSAASAACDAVLALRSRRGAVRCLQEWYEIAAQEDAVEKGLKHQQENTA